VLQSWPLSLPIAVFRTHSNQIARLLLFHKLQKYHGTTRESLPKRCVEGAVTAVELCLPNRICCCHCHCRCLQLDDQQGYGRGEGCWALPTGRQGLRGGGWRHYPLPVQRDRQEKVIFTTPALKAAASMLLARAHSRWREWCIAREGQASFCLPVRVRKGGGRCEAFAVSVVCLSWSGTAKPFFGRDCLASPDLNCNQPGLRVLFAVPGVVLTACRQARHGSLPGMHWVWVQATCTPIDSGCWIPLLQRALLEPLRVSARVHSCHTHSVYASPLLDSAGCGGPKAALTLSLAIMQTVSCCWGASGPGAQMCMHGGADM